MNEILKQVEKIEEKIFNYNFNAVQTNINKVIESIYPYIDDINENRRNTINQVLNYINIALENSDYLFLADVLRYELVPWINAANN